MDMIRASKRKSHPVAPDETPVWYNEITHEVYLMDLK